MAKKPSWLARGWFLLFVALAVVYALHSLRYPLGPDQAASFHISREWWQNNLLPYRDIPDSRIPGIHFVYLLARIFFGAHPYSIRVLEMIVVLASGVAAAQAAARRRLSLLELGPAVLLASVFYYSYVDAADSAQAEIWAGICLLAAQSTLAVDRNRRKASIVAGLWCGCAVILDLQALLFLPILFTQALVAGVKDRPETSRLPSVVEISAAFSLGLVQPPAFFAAYFATRGAFRVFYQNLIHAGFHAGGWPGGLGEFAARARWQLIVAGALWAVALLLRIIMTGESKKREPLWGSSLAPLFVVAALLGFYVAASTHPSRWVILLPTLTWCAADGLLSLWTLARRRA